MQIWISFSFFFVVVVVVHTNFQMSAAIVTHLMILLQFQVSENYQVDKIFYKKITGIYGTNGNGDDNSDNIRTWINSTK